MQEEARAAENCTWGRKCVREVSEKEGRREGRREAREGCEGGVHGADLSVDSAKMSRLRCGNVFRRVNEGDK